MVGEYMIYIDEDEPVDHVSEDFMHEILEDGRSVGQPIRHNPVLVVPGGCHEGRLPFVPSADADEIIGTP